MGLSKAVCAEGMTGGGGGGAGGTKYSVIGTGCGLQGEKPHQQRRARQQASPSLPRREWKPYPKSLTKCGLGPFSTASGGCGAWGCWARLRLFCRLLAGGR